MKEGGQFLSWNQLALVIVHLLVKVITINKGRWLFAANKEEEDIEMVHSRQDKER